MILLMQAAGTPPADAPLAYVVHYGDAAGALARRVAESLRDAGHAVVVNAGGGSFKSQMKKADASGSRYALIIGDDEAASGTVAGSALPSGEAQVLLRGQALPLTPDALSLAIVAREAQPDGPPRITSITTTGISAAVASPSASIISERPGPDVAVRAGVPPKEAPMIMLIAASSSSACSRVPPRPARLGASHSRISVAGVIG